VETTDPSLTSVSTLWFLGDFIPRILATKEVIVMFRNQQHRLQSSCAMSGGENP